MPQRNHQDVTLSHLVGITDRHGGVMRHAMLFVRAFEGTRSSSVVPWIVVAAPVIAVALMSMVVSVPAFMAITRIPPEWAHDATADKHGQSQQGSDAAPATK